jgi:hypothetical protein
MDMIRAGDSAAVLAASVGIISAEVHRLDHVRPLFACAPCLKEGRA